MRPTTLAAALCVVLAAAVTIVTARQGPTLDPRVRQRAPERVMAASSSSDPSVVVQTQQGEVVGTVEEVDGIRIRAFRGIPYAADTSGENRWRAPQDPEPWSEPFDASAFGPICPQSESWYMNMVPRAIEGLDGDLEAYTNNRFNSLVESEDCLRINVYTPASKPPPGDAPSWPVMFRIHEG